MVSENSEVARAELLELILEVSFRRGKVTLASGKQSDFYLDLRQTLMRPRGIALAGALVLERLDLLIQAMKLPFELFGDLLVRLEV